MNDSLFMEKFQGNKHLICNKSNSFDAKGFTLFLEYTVKVVVEFFHDHEGVLLKDFVGVYFREPLSIHQVNHHFEFLLNQDSFLQIENLILFHDFFIFCMHSIVRYSSSGQG